MIETMKLIPSAFFDILARLIPGAALLLTLAAIWDTSWQELVEVLFGTTMAENAGASLTLFLAGGYAAGHLLSGPGKVIQRVGEWVDKRWVPIYNEFEQQDDGEKEAAGSAEKGDVTEGLSSTSQEPTADRSVETVDPIEEHRKISEKVASEIRARQTAVPKQILIRVLYWRSRGLTHAPSGTNADRPPKEQRRKKKLKDRSDKYRKRRINEKWPENGYDYLRTYHPDLGAQCAKIRAEFTMHNAFSAAALISSVAYSVNRIEKMSDTKDWSPWVFLVLLAVAFLESLRGWSTNVTQKSTISKFMKVSAAAPRTYGAAGNVPPAKAGSASDGQSHA